MLQGSQANKSPGRQRSQFAKIDGQRLQIVKGPEMVRSQLGLKKEHVGALDFQILNLLQSWIGYLHSSRGRISSKIQYF